MNYEPADSGDEAQLAVGKLDFVSNGATCTWKNPMSPCQSVLVGGTFALHATVHNRFLQMNGHPVLAQ